jgi:antitoxin component YwqK of YwqJK toxin-antitoxin module
LLSWVNILSVTLSPSFSVAFILAMNNDGQLISKGLYSQNHENGNWYGWYDNSKPRFEKLYENGDIIYSREWDEKGNPIK